MQNVYTLSGNIVSDNTYVLSGNLVTDNQYVLTGSLSLESAKYERYKGEYTVNPKVTEQELECKDKLMDNNVTVTAIYYNSTENDSGGYTVQIGDI
jgi:hypothetical protein